MSATLLPRLAVSLIIAAVAGAPSCLVAQPIWLNRSDPGITTIEILKPSFKGNADQASALIAFLSGRIPLAERTRLVLEIPYWRAELDAGFSAQFSESGLGNPWIGMELGIPDASIQVELGVRVPVVAGDKSTIAFPIMGDVDRMEAFLPEIVAVGAALNFSDMTSRGLALHVRGAPLIMIPSGSSEMDSEVFVNYSLFAGYDKGHASFLTGVTGRTLVTGDEDDVGDRSIHQFAVNAGLWLGSMRPGLQLRIPLSSDLQDVISTVISASLSLRLR